MELFWADPSPISSALVPLLFLDNSIWCMFTELFNRCQNHHQMEEINYLMTMSM